MSWRSDGTCRCDRCDAEVGNGSVMEAVVVADLLPSDPTTPRTLHFGRAEGCAERVLSEENTKAWRDTHP